MKKKLKIFIDHQIYSFQDYGGISRVFTELCKEFKKNDVVEYVLPILYSNNQYIGDIKRVSSFFPKIKSFIKLAIMYLLNRIYSTFKLLFTKYDIFQPTYYDPYFLPFLRGKPFVLLVHDMTHEIFPGNASKKDKTVEWKRKLVNRADKILAISESTRRDIIKFYNIPGEKIDIVSWGTSIRVPDGKIDLKLPKRYLLYVGNRSKYKNFQKFFESIKNILKEDKDLYLICAGGGKFNEEEKRIIDESGVEDRVEFIFFKDDTELAYIYHNALCFVFPSLYEGFGIPVLEAFACSCPAVISNTSSLPEVGGDAVEYFNPEDSESIGKAVRKVVYDVELRKELKRKGFDRLRMFGWEKAAKQFVNVYNKI